jgi:hypothetical protein
MAAIEKYDGTKTEIPVGDDLPIMIRGRTTITLFAPRFSGGHVEPVKRKVEDYDLFFLGWRVEPAGGNVVRLLIFVDNGEKPK